MYQEMRRKKHERGEQAAIDYLNSAEWGVLSLAAEGLPYGVPLSHALVGRTLYFHCAREGQKLDFIRANPLGFFTAVASADVKRSQGSVEFESAMAFGPVRIVDDPAERLAAFDAINARFTESFELGRTFVKEWGADASVLALDIERITAKSNRKEG